MGVLCRPPSGNPPNCTAASLHALLTWPLMLILRLPLGTILTPPTHAVNSENKGHHLANIVRSLQQNEQLAEDIAAAGLMLSKEALTTTRVQAYWWYLLAHCRDLQTFRPTTLHPDAVPLENSVLLAEVRSNGPEVLQIEHAMEVLGG